MMCQKEIYKKIAGKKWDYVLAVKKSHPTMFKEIRTLLEGKSIESWQIYETNDKGHGRIEKRIYYLDTNIKRFSSLREWKNLGHSANVKAM